VEGLLIATGSAPLPQQYLHASSFKMPLILIDQFDSEYVANLHVKVMGRVVEGTKGSRALIEEHRSTQNHPAGIVATACSDMYIPRKRELKNASASRIAPATPIRF
jgi:hypothetical protein